LADQQQIILTAFAGKFLENFSQRILLPETRRRYFSAVFRHVAVAFPSQRPLSNKCHDLAAV